MFTAIKNFVLRIWQAIFGKKKVIRDATPVTIHNPLDYLVQKNKDGNYVKSTDLVTVTRRDRPLPLGWEASNSVLLPDGRVLQTFSFAPWKEFNPANGDGGQIAVVGPDGWVRFTQTRDGGKPYMQYFIGGTGWIVFGVDAVSGQWKEVIATLTGSNSSTYNNQALSQAYTRYRLENIKFKFANNGIEYFDTLPTIITEHYDGISIENSHALERSYLALGYGLIRWEAWTKKPATIGDMNVRYFHVSFSDPPAIGWYVNDIRTFTNKVDIEPTAIPIMT